MVPKKPLLIGERLSIGLKEKKMLERRRKGREMRLQERGQLREVIEIEPIPVKGQISVDGKRQQR